MKGATTLDEDGYIINIISIHAPNEGSDLEVVNFAKRKIRFQSTLPMKGATEGGKIKMTIKQISIHAPNEGSDYKVIFNTIK